MRKRSVIDDEAEDIFATSESELSPSDGDRESDEDFIADDEEPTSALDPREQRKVDRDVYTRASLQMSVECSPEPERREKKGKTPKKGGSEKPSTGMAPTSARGRGKSVVCKEIGHASFPLNSFSLTISRIKGDVDPSLLDAVQAVLEPISTKFVLGLEVGIRAFNMHIQGVISLLMPKTDIYVRELKSIIKQVLPLRGKGFKIQIKPFSVGQTFSSMIGYCTKDQGKGHYQVRVHNVSPAVILERSYFLQTLLTLCNRSCQLDDKLMSITEPPLMIIKEYCPLNRYLLSHGAMRTDAYGLCFSPFITQFSTW